jgi:Zn-finger nucleic acid-binding protein
MMEAAQYSRPIDPPPPQPGYAPQYQQRPPEPRYDDRDRHRDHGRWGDDDYRKKKRRGMDIFDIFD